MIKIIKAVLNPKLAIRPSHAFSDVWKDRDDAAEKVYITRSESKPFMIVKDKQ